MALYLLTNPIKQRTKCYHFTVLKIKKSLFLRVTKDRPLKMGSNNISGIITTNNGAKWIRKIKVMMLIPCKMIAINTFTYLVASSIEFSSEHCRYGNRF